MCLQSSTMNHMVTNYLQEAVVDSHFRNLPLHHLNSLLLQEVVGTCEGLQSYQEVPRQCFLLEVFPQSFCNKCELVPLERGFCTGGVI